MTASSNINASQPPTGSDVDRPVATAAKELGTLPRRSLLLWAVGAVGSFHLAYSSPVGFCAMSVHADTAVELRNFPDDPSGASPSPSREERVGERRPFSPG